jgi:acetyl esterase/lipase
MACVIVIHGGGWSKGTYKDHVGINLAMKGYFVANVEYRLSGEAKWPAQIEDCKMAVRWLRANAAKYNIDPNHIGCMGSSAGGHLAACLGTMGDDKKFEGNGGYWRKKSTKRRPTI